MYVVPDHIRAAMASTPYGLQLTFDGSGPMDPSTITDMLYTAGTNSDGDHPCIGSTVAATVELTMEKAALPTTSSRFSLALEVAGTSIPMGRFTITDSVRDDASVAVTAMDALGTEFAAVYAPLPGVDFTVGVAAPAFLAALCARRGVPVNVDGLEAVLLRGFDPVGVPEREIIGWVAAMYGRFACVDRQGVLQLRWYSATGCTVSPEDYYEDGLQLADYAFRAAWLKCYNEAAEQTLCLGDPEAAQGLFMACPWMDDARLELLWQSHSAFAYTPAKGLRILGNPTLDPGDMIVLEDLSGRSCTVPVMGISHDWDGGIISSITADGQARTDSTDGPVQQATRRSLARILKKANELELAILDLDGTKIVTLVNLSPEGVKLQGDKIQLEGIVTANEGFKILLNGSMEATSGLIGGWNIAQNGLFYTDSTGQIRLIPGANLSQAYTVNGRTSTAWRILAGAAEPSNPTVCNFGLDEKGQVYCRGMDASGRFTSTASDGRSAELGSGGLKLARADGSRTLEARNLDTGLFLGAYGKNGKFVGLGGLEHPLLFAYDGSLNAISGYIPVWEVIGGKRVLVGYSSTAEMPAEIREEETIE